MLTSAARRRACQSSISVVACPSATGRETVQAPVKVLYIAGYPRSGSTLLERLLDDEGDLVSVGELRRVWERGFLANELCSCGAPFHSCPFWTEVVKEAFGGPAGVDAEAMAAAVHSLATRRGRWRAVGRRVGGGPPPAGDGPFDEVLARLYRGVLTVSGSSAVVDSSKDSTYGFVLAGTAGIEVDMVHLVRDSRAVAYSWQRRRRRPEIVGRAEYMPTIRPSGAAVGWVARNLSVEALRWFTNRHVCLRYEDLAEAPADAVRRAIGSEGLPAVGVRCKSADGYHAVSGNPMRLTTGRPEVKPDVEWMSALGRRDRAVITALTLPLLLRYGYAPFRASER